MTVAGTIVGRYELLRLIAAGGMGEVYLARQQSTIEGFTALVAVKMLLRNLSSNQMFVRMFLDEARIVGRLHHKNIVQVRDVAQHEGQYFMAMEYIPGQNLRELLGDASIRDRPLFDARLGAEMFGEIAGALAVAHDAGLVHRDISPNNIMISDDGMGKLIDFGVARALSSASMTIPGTLKGKFGYMAPEYVRNSSYDQRVDLFSLGVVMWETFARRRLFRGTNEAAQLHQLLESPIPPLDQEVPGFPPALADIVASALERDPERRIPSALALSLELGELVRSLPGGADLTLRQWLERRIPGRLEDRRRTDEMLKSLPAGAPVPDFGPAAYEIGHGGSVPGTYNFQPAPTERQSGPIVARRTGSNANNNSGTSIRLANGETTPPPPPARSRRAIWIGASIGLIAIALVYLLGDRGGSPPAPAMATATIDAVPWVDTSLAEAHRQIGLKAMTDEDFGKARSEFAEALRAGGSGDLMQLMQMASQLETEAAARDAGSAAAADPPPTVVAAVDGTHRGKQRDRKDAKGKRDRDRPEPRVETSSTRADVRVEPEAARPPTPTTGDLVVTSIVPKALVLVDGRVMGQTPVRVKVDPGSHELRVTSGSQVLRSQPVAIKAGGTTVVNVETPAEVAVAPTPPPTAAPPKVAPTPPAAPTPRPTPRITGVGDIATGARAVGQCNSCHTRSGVRGVASRRYTRAQWDRFFATGQHDRYLPIGDQMNAAQLKAAKAFLSASAADAPENQGAGVREP
jgi:serine/threonine protein kinase